MNPDHPRLLVVDDEPAARYSLLKALKKLNLNIKEAADGRQAIESIHSFEPDVILCDINMPEVSGLDVLKHVRQSQAALPPLVVMITAYGSERIAVDAMKNGAYDYLCKPYDIDELRVVVKNAVERMQLKRENLQLRSRVAGMERRSMLGDSEPLKNVRAMIAKVAPTDVTVLITGESGTGKEMAAQTIHRGSRRTEKPFVTMNCAAIPKDLVESELFGHEKGSFTGATEQRRGKFELADGGTLFLDEIADMSLETQSKILRVLEEKAFMRLGGKDVIHTDVRLISATNKDLQAEMEAGRFRQDLYYRLKVVELKMPALRNRREDIPALVQHFLQTFAARHEKPVTGIESAAMRLLMQADWPGNIRQLMHVIEQSVVLCDSRTLQPADLPADVQTPAAQPAFAAPGEVSFSDAKQKAVTAFERGFIEQALQRTNGNISQAARLLQMTRQFLQAKIRDLEIDADAFRGK